MGTKKCRQHLMRHSLQIGLKNYDPQVSIFFLGKQTWSTPPGPEHMSGGHLTQQILNAVSA